MLEVRPPPVPDLPPITQTTFLTCRAQYPGGPNRCVSVSSLSARPSPFNGRVGIHNFTFEACSSFTRVTACKIACPPKGGLLSRGFDPASYPTKPLGSYHVLPTTTWMDPPSTGDLRRFQCTTPGRHYDNAALVQFPGLTAFHGLAMKFRAGFILDAFRVSGNFAARHQRGTSFQYVENVCFRFMKFRILFALLTAHSHLVARGALKQRVCF